MTVDEALYILNNTAWLGSNDDRDKTEEAVKVVEEALKLDFWQDGTLKVHTRHYNDVKRVLIENGTNGTLFYPDDDERNNHNSAYVSGYNDALKEIKEAMKELADFDTVDILVEVAWLIDEHKK